MTGISTESSAERVVLCILDGYGWRTEESDNAVRLANTPVFDRYFENSPASFLRTDGQYVGLPSGQFGNSEVGHLNLGAGRVVMQDLPRIDAAIDDGLENRPSVQRFLKSCASGSGRVHVIGLMSPGGVHAHQRHMAAIVRLLEQSGLKVAIHLITDGRDTPPTASTQYLMDFEDDIADLDNAEIVSVCGRYYAMDRDNRWERIELAYRAIAEGIGEAAENARMAIVQCHEQAISDEFITPHVIQSYSGFADGDALLCINFRADRVRQILSAMVGPDFDGFIRCLTKWSAVAGMTSYSADLDKVMAAWVPTPSLHDLLGDVLAAAGRSQVRMAETEKYPHVTFFFNGGREEPAAGEERLLVPSPKVATYDLAPEMSARELTELLEGRLKTAPPDFLLINFANPDMVGHTGDLAAAIKAVETVDECLGRLIDAGVAQNAVILVTADHGNCELMRDPISGGPHTAHTTNPVPVMLINGPPGATLRKGSLADIAPTILDLMGLAQPATMTGRSLLGGNR